jgi:hypothetical protein
MTDEHILVSPRKAGIRAWLILINCANKRIVLQLGTGAGTPHEAGGRTSDKMVKIKVTAGTKRPGGAIQFDLGVQSECYTARHHYIININMDHGAGYIINKRAKHDHRSSRHPAFFRCPELVHSPLARGYHLT